MFQRTVIYPVKRRLAVALLPVMQAELAHLGENTIRRPMDMMVRINCGKQIDSTCLHVWG
jgi:hypothetical protein